MRRNDLTDKEIPKHMVRKAVNLSLSPKVINRLGSLAKKHNMSKSRMVETLVYNAYDNNCDLSPTMIRQRIDDMTKHK